MPGLVKIGRTTRSPQQRLTELWQTGVPTPFEVYHYVRTPSCVQLEALCHQALADVRVDEAREFFQISPEDAKKVLTEHEGEVLYEWLNIYRPDHEIVHYELFVDPSEILIAAHDNQVEPRVIILAIGMLKKGDLDSVLPAAIARYNYLVHRQ
jgi:hypothetical protein